MEDQPVEVAGQVAKGQLRFSTIQADIFDHLIAIMPAFGLNLYQRPAGSNLVRSAFA